MIIFVIVIAIVFDMISTSALTSDEASFHAMNSKKIKGAKEAIYLIRNNVKVVSICSDVIGDILGIASGGLGAVLAINLSQTTDFNVAITGIIIAAFISAFTVGGKAIFREIAIKNNAKIIFRFGKIFRIFKKKLK